MFSKLFKSTARKRLFKIFLDDGRQESRQHSSKYYLRELSELLNYSAGSLQRELTGLERDGFLIAEKMGNMKFFSLNKKHPFIGELKKYLDQGPREIKVINIAASSNGIGSTKKETKETKETSSAIFNVKNKELRELKTKFKEKAIEEENSRTEKAEEPVRIHIA